METFYQTHMKEEKCFNLRNERTKISPLVWKLKRKIHPIKLFSFSMFHTIWFYCENVLLSWLFKFHGIPTAIIFLTFLEKMQRISSLKVRQMEKNQNTLQNKFINTF